MSGIAGVARPGAHEIVGRMLDGLSHRGRAGRAIIEKHGVTLGLVAGPLAGGALARLHDTGCAADDLGGGHVACAEATPAGPVLTRDALGVVPLYHGQAPDGALAFASEVKALLEVTRDVHELPPGTVRSQGRDEAVWTLRLQPPWAEEPAGLAAGLRQRLAAAVASRIGGGTVGSWLSGGLDSSAMAALARPHVRELHTFAVGLPGAPDLPFARQVAEFIGARHHEVVVRAAELPALLPAVIRHLESFDALLVRSSLTNFVAAKAAAEEVAAVFSGEGGDELFAGYEYLKALDPAALPAELVDITGRLHNTALQRVDRSAAAHGLTAYVPFLDAAVVEFALRIPATLKLHGGVEKWILRQALAGALPAAVLERPKAKFWEGAGVGDHLAAHAATRISDADFRRERRLPNGWQLNSKEELLYYRVFHEQFGEVTDLDWMGRTKGVTAEDAP